MPVFRRLSDLATANLNDLIERFEDPEKMLRQGIREMERAVEVALERAVSAVAHEKLLATQIAELRSRVERLREHAVKAVGAGDDARARIAVARRRRQEKLLAEREERHVAAARVGRTLRTQIGNLRKKLGETRAVLTTLAARKSIADAQRALIVSSTTGAGIAATRSVDRWIGRLQRAEAEAEAWCELSGAADFEELESDDENDIDQEIAALKEGLAK
jgi:phage shock protein A